VAAEADEPAVADADAADAADTAGQLSAGEFRQVLLRSNRGPAVHACYFRHTAGVEQRVETVITVSPRGRVQKLRIESGPLGDCLRQVVMRLEFPPAARSARHNYVFRTPIDK
jgi:hypothetical protein